MRTGVAETVAPYLEAQAARWEPSWSTGTWGLIEGSRNGGRPMEDRQRNLMKRLLDRLLATRARRDREERDSPPWRAADTELHEIERAIFRVPPEEALPTPSADQSRAAPTGLPRRLRRAAPMARARGIQGHSAG